MNVSMGGNGVRQTYPIADSMGGKRRGGYQRRDALRAVRHSIAVRPFR
jgi:hypothetical protein